MPGSPNAGDSSPADRSADQAEMLYALTRVFDASEESSGNPEGAVMLIWYSGFPPAFHPPTVTMHRLLVIGSGMTGVTAPPALFDIAYTSYGAKHPRSRTRIR